MDCLEPISSPLRDIQHHLIVRSEDDCVDTMSISILVETFRDFSVPTAFTPNNDGMNDRFYLIGGKEVQSIDLSIFNRWGQMVFQSVGMSAIDVGNAWDGTFKNVSSASGAYLWMANIQFIDGFSETYKGNVTLVR